MSNFRSSKLLHLMPIVSVKPQIEEILFFCCIDFAFYHLHISVTYKKIDFLFCLCAKVIRWLVPNSLMLYVFYFDHESEEQNILRRRNLSFQLCFKCCLEKNDGIVLFQHQGVINNHVQFIKLLVTKTVLAEKNKIMTQIGSQCLP